MYFDLKNLNFYYYYLILKCLLLIVSNFIYFFYFSFIIYFIFTKINQFQFIIIIINQNWYLKIIVFTVIY